MFLIKNKNKIFVFKASNHWITFDSKYSLSLVGSASSGAVPPETSHSFISYYPLIWVNFDIALVGSSYTATGSFLGITTVGTSKSNDILPERIFL